MSGKGGHEVVAAKRVDHEDRAKVGNQHRDFLDTLPRTWPILARRGYKDVRPCCDHDRCDLADIEGWVQRGRYACRCAPPSRNQSLRQERRNDRNGRLLISRPGLEQIRGLYCPGQDLRITESPWLGRKVGGH